MSPPRSAWRALLAICLASALVGVAWLATRPLGAPPDAASVASGFYPIGSATQGTAIGQRAPAVARAANGTPLLTNLDGAAIDLSDYAGRPVWIVFWASWCTPCQEEVADIRATYDAHRQDRLVVLAVDVQEPGASVRDYAEAHDIDYEIGLDATGAVRDSFGAWGLPAHFFLDADGIVRDRYLGQLTAAGMEDHLRSIIGG